MGCTMPCERSWKRGIPRNIKYNSIIMHTPRQSVTHVLVSLIVLLREIHDVLHGMVHPIPTSPFIELNDFDYTCIA